MGLDSNAYSNMMTGNSNTNIIADANTNTTTYINTHAITNVNGNTIADTSKTEDYLILHPTCEYKKVARVLLSTRMLNG